jgi:hypothetical protein
MKQFPLISLLCLSLLPLACSGNGKDLLESLQKKSSSSDDTAGTDDKGGQRTTKTGDDTVHADDKGVHTEAHGSVIMLGEEKAFFETRIRGFLKVEIRNALGAAVKVDQLKVRLVKGEQVLADSFSIVRDDGLSSEWEISGYDFAKAASDKELILELNFVRDGQDHIATQALSTVRID